MLNFQKYEEPSDLFSSSYILYYFLFFNNFP